MSATQEQIDKLYTLTQQNKDLIAYVNSLIPAAEQAALSEIAIGKQDLVDALRTWGIDCSIKDSLTTLAEKMSALTSMEQVIVDCEFTDAVPRPLSLPYFIAEYAKEIISAGSEDVNYIKPFAFENCTYLKSVSFPNSENVGHCAYQNCSLLEKANFLNASVLYESNNAYQFYKCTNLIDITIGKRFASSISFSKVSYSPTNAMKKGSSSLCYDTDIEEYGQTFASNWDKWKWCIINHMAANLPDNTGGTAYTITFGATVLGNFDDEMKLAFTNKNWNLA